MADAMLGALRMMWLASPTLPVGGFSYSEGLEAAVQAGIVCDEAECLEWLRSQLRLVLTRSELPMLLAAHAAWARHDVERLQGLQRWLLCTRETAESRQQTLQMGRSMLEWLRTLHPRLEQLQLASRLDASPGWPLAYALGALAFGLDAEQAAQAFAFSWLENQVQAALRCVPLGQSSGQRLLAALTPELPQAIGTALGIAADPQAWQCFAPHLAILGALHETQYSRLFRS